jgi:hypothetical protein
MPARLLLLCLLFRSSWLTVEGDRHVGAAGVLHRRGGRAAVAVRVGVAGGVPEEQRRMARSGQSGLLHVRAGAVLGVLPVGGSAFSCSDRFLAPTGFTSQARDACGRALVLSSAHRVDRACPTSLFSFARKRGSTQRASSHGRGLRSPGRAPRAEPPRQPLSTAFCRSLHR